MEILQGVMQRLILLGLAAVPTALAKIIVSLHHNCQLEPAVWLPVGTPILLKPWGTWGLSCAYRKCFTLSTPLASPKMKHLYLRKGFVLEAMLQTSHFLIPRCSKAYGTELCSLASLPFGGKASLIMVLNNIPLSLWDLDICAAGDI